MVDLCIHVEADLLAVLQLLGYQLHLLRVDQPHGLVLSELFGVDAVVVIASGQNLPLLLPKLPQNLTVLLLVAGQPFDQSQQSFPEGIDQPPREEFEFVAVFYHMQVFQGISIRKQFVDVCDQV